MKKFNPEHSHLSFLYIFIYYTENSGLVQGWSAGWHSTGSEHRGKWISWSCKLCRVIDWKNRQTITKKTSARMPPCMHTQNLPALHTKRKQKPSNYFLLTLLGEEFPTVTALGLCRWAVWVCVGSSKNIPRSWFCECSLLIFSYYSVCSINRLKPVNLHTWAWEPLSEFWVGVKEE